MTEARIWLFFVLLFVVLGIESKVLHILNKCSAIIYIHIPEFVVSWTSFYCLRIALLQDYCNLFFKFCKACMISRWTLQGMIRKVPASVLFLSSLCIFHISVFVYVCNKTCIDIHTGMLIHRAQKHMYEYIIDIYGCTRSHCMHIKDTCTQRHKRMQICILVVI